MQKFRLYLQLLRLHKPIGFLLLLWPTLWGLWLAHRGMPSLTLLLIFIVGTLVTRSAGCVINDMADQRLDRHVARTRTRPLASQQLSKKEAWAMLFFLALIALGLALCLNRLAFYYCVAAAGIASIYPFMKRITFFPQVILGVAFSMGIPIAYAATRNEVPPHAWYLFFLSLLWPLMYDSAYAMTDYPDDLKIGVKSTATFFHAHTPQFIAILQCLIMLGLIVLQALEKLSPSFFVSIVVVGLLFLYQQRLLKTQRPFQAFLNNHWVGFVIWSGIVLCL